MMHTLHGVVSDIAKYRECEALLKTDGLQVVGWDTETTGLHIKCDSPFLFVIGVYKKSMGLHTFVLDLELYPKASHRLIALFFEVAKTVQHTIAHNIKFDMHMSANLGYEPRLPNLTDTITCIRLAHDNLQVEAGGPPLGLKDYAAKFIDRKAKLYDKALQSYRTMMAQQLNRKLQNALNATGKPPTGYRSWTIKALDDLFKDPLFTVDQLEHPEQVQAYEIWYNDLHQLIRYSMATGYVTGDDIPYNLVPRNLVHKYAEIDVVLAFKVLEATLHVIKARGNEEALDIERRLIIPLYDMERVGFAHDLKYIQESKIRVADYLRQQRNKLNEYMPGITVGQHLAIKRYFSTLGVELPSSNAESLNKLADHPNPLVANPARLIVELRTLSKWYVTYIVRIERQALRSDRLYTALNQNGAVSGRLTSDFQQFPKYPIKTEDGAELFHPRRMIRVSGAPYSRIAYLDYSQVELRVQALYTILLGTPDLNLCRAYMPLQCHRKDGTQYDIYNPAILAQ